MDALHGVVETAISHERKRMTRVAYILAAATVSIVLVGQYLFVGSTKQAQSDVSATASRIERMVSTAMEAVQVESQYLETSWTDARNAEHTVRTHRAPGEDTADWAMRHQEAVDALQAIYPPVP